MINKGRVRIIAVTDGDHVAQRAVQAAGHALGLRTISRSAGNPTLLSGQQILALAKEAPWDPVIVMVDDHGDPRYGMGERALEFLMESPECDVVGVIAVASDTPTAKGTAVHFSIDCGGAVVHWPVNKFGEVMHHSRLKGDTVDLLSYHAGPLVVGIGDIGKMHGCDSFGRGVPITTRAIAEILRRRKIQIRQRHPVHS